ncbi:hypothetical protein [Oligella urethralis]|uniref:hypothetical protein n=1 Tax=Oligella urethralis TaxID=90245 RepID=UPI00068EC525|nr:hypothetical protein [Oligella urethralis]
MKYELTGDTLTFQGRQLHRICALVDLPEIGVKAGDLGGWIEKVENLSQEGNAWVADEAKAYDSTQVTGNALLKNHAVAFDQTLLTDDVVVSDYAVISGEAEIQGEAKVSGGGLVTGVSLLANKAQVSEYAQVVDSSVLDDGKVLHSAQVLNGSEIRDKAIAFGNAQIRNGSVLSDEALVYGQAILSGVEMYHQSQVHGNAKVAAPGSQLFDNVNIHGNTVISNAVWIHDQVKITGDVMIDKRQEIKGDFTISSQAQMESFYKWGVINESVKALPESHQADGKALLDLATKTISVLSPQMQELALNNVQKQFDTLAKAHNEQMEIHHE